LKGNIVSQILNTLKFVQAKRVAMNVNPTEFRRHKLARRIDEQIALVNQLGEGLDGAVTRTKRVTNIDGTTATVEVQRKARAWWFQSEKGTLCVSIRYGAKAIELAKGRNAIEIGSVEQLASTLETVKKAVISGELDAQITATAEAVKARFKKR
jgi:hypothetical protein